MTIYNPNTGTKQNLNTGTPGQVGTADTVNAGGVKIADNFDQIYDALGDLRVSSSGTQEGKQFIHPGGVYQLLDQSSNLYPGGKYTVDTTGLPQNIILTLPPIEIFSPSTYDGTYAVSGTRITLQDATNSWGTTGITVRTSPGNTITGAFFDGNDLPGTQKIYVLENDQEVTLIANYDPITGNANWNVHTRNMNTFEPKPSEVNQFIDDNQETIVQLLDIRSFKSIKYLVYAEEIDTSGYTVRNSTAEVLLLSLPEQKVSSTPQEMSSTQYASVIWDENDADYNDLFEYEFIAYFDTVANKPIASIAISSNIVSPNALNVSINTINVI